MGLYQYTTNHQCDYIDGISTETSMLPKISITIFQHTHTLVLLESNMIGRSVSLGAGRINFQKLPEFWLEIRYFRKQWHWRALEGLDKTKGVGTFVDPNWRQFTSSIKYANVLKVDLLSDRPPQPLWENLNTHRRLPLVDMEGCTQDESGFHIETEGGQRTLQNGEIFTHNHSPVAVWIPEDIQPTLDDFLKINHIKNIDIDLKRGKMVFTGSQSQSIVYQGEGTRVLAAYVLAGSEKPDRWVSNQDVYSCWIDLGGNPDSKVARINWERNKLCTSLYKAGIAGTQQMFDRVRRGQTWFMQLNIEPEVFTIT